MRLSIGRPTLLGYSLPNDPQPIISGNYWIVWVFVKVLIKVWQLVEELNKICKGRNTQFGLKV